MPRCLSCGSAYLDPRPAPEALPDAYDGYYTHDGPAVEHEPFGAVSRLRRAMRNGYVNRRYGYRLEPSLSAGRLLFGAIPPLRAVADRQFHHLPAGGRLLDVGCGGGDWVAQASLFGWQAEGIDVDEQAVAAGLRAGLDLRLDTVEAAAAERPATYDAVTMSHVIEHVTDPRAFCHSAFELLRPGGRLWIATPNLRALTHRVHRATWVGLDPPRHLVLFTPESLEQVVRAAGFKSVQLRVTAPRAVEIERASRAAAGGLPFGSHVRLPAGAMARSALVSALSLADPTVGHEIVLVGRRGGAR